jgi:hypothetical protein
MKRERNPGLIFPGLRFTPSGLQLLFERFEPLERLELFERFERLQ